MQLRLAKTTGLHVCEVGVGDLFTCKSRSFWDDRANTVSLFEPNPLLYASLLRKTRAHDNVRLYNVAIANENRLGDLVSAGILSHLPHVPSPIESIFKGKLAPMLDALKVTVNLMTFDTFDRGDIDILILGMEGAEHMVFETLKSRPPIIVMNNHFANDYRYTFPRWDVIQQWCDANGYQICPGIPDITLVNVSAAQSGAVIAS